MDKKALVGRGAISGAPHSASKKEFRSDINGLRAWAVAAVVLYHFGIPGFSGGFSGVDVFFVISGFLMASIAVGGIEKNSFGLFRFYVARARRIVPALLVVVMAVLIVGGFILMPNDYQELGRHARESVFFTSNVQYLSEAGYFDTSAHEKWLLHTWSLSVEWQFYLIYPVLLICFSRFFKLRHLVYLHAAGTLLSFGIGVAWLNESPDRAFYLLPSRAWEMLLGGLVFLLGSEVVSDRAGRVLERLGLGLILAAILFVDASMSWPGWLALFPTLGTALVLMVGRQDSILTSSSIAQWLGTRSYSIYLWHWPLVVMLTYYSIQDEVVWVVLAIGFSLLLGHFSFHLVEKPARQWLSTRSDIRSVTVLLLCAVLVSVTAQLVRRSGFPERLPTAIAAIDAERHNKNPRQKECLNSEARCIYGGEEVAALVIGDSHADAIVTAVVGSLPDLSRQGIYFRGESGCLLVEGANWALGGKKDACINLRRELSEELVDAYPGKPVILINRVTSYVMGDAFNDPESNPQPPMVYFSRRVDFADDEYLEEFRKYYLDSVCLLSKERDVYVLMPVPDMPLDVPKAMGRSMLRGLPANVSITRDQYDARNGFVRNIMTQAADQCNIKLLDPVPYMCDQDYCYGQRNGVPLYVDDDHLSEYGNRYLIPLFRPIFSSSASAFVQE